MFEEDALKDLLDLKYVNYNKPGFIEFDPISVPHSFSQKENIEISAFLTAAISWGRRPMIIANAKRLMQLLDNNPYNFIVNAKSIDYKVLIGFCHRTFNGPDTVFFVKSLAHIYKNLGGLEEIITSGYNKSDNIIEGIIKLRQIFFETEHFPRSEKHFANILKGSSAKRLNMFLRWMVRKDSKGVDFGLWPGIPPSALYIPLDVHTGNVARNLKLLARTQNDWRAVEELTTMLRKFDPVDPVKYDFALFGMGVFEGHENISSASMNTRQF